MTSSHISIGYISGTNEANFWSSNLRFYIPMSTLQAWVISRSEIFSNFYLFIIDLFIYLFIYLLEGRG